jgi:carbon storage regulator
MLVLTRKLMEKLFIGDDICVTVVRLEGGQVRLGIEAPREVAVVRAELVPERAGVYRANANPLAARRQQGSDAGTPPPPAHATARPEATIRTPRASVHGTDNRRREPSR